MFSLKLKIFKFYDIIKLDIIDIFILELHYYFSYIIYIFKSYVINVTIVILVSIAYI